MLENNFLVSKSSRRRDIDQHWLVVLTFRSLKLDRHSVLASASEYIIDEAYFYGGTVTFNPGTYWFNELEIKGDAVVIINGAVTFYVNGQSKHLDIEGTAQVNLGGHAQNLAIVSYKEIHLKDDSQVNAVLYSDGHEIKLENNSRHIGSISSFGKV